MAKKEGFEKTKKKGAKKKKAVFFTAVFVIGLVIGLYLGSQFLYPYLNAPQLQAQADELKACDLLRQENDCYLNNCPQEIIEQCGLK